MLSIRSNIALATLVATVFMVGTTSAQNSITNEAPKAVTEIKEISIEVSRRGLPVPSLRYRLLTAETELNPGDAAPIYLRLGYELPDGALRQADTKTMAWLGLPLDKFPVLEAKALVQGWFPQLQQIEFGTRRQTCEWNYTALEEQDNPYLIRMPDMQTMRVWGRLLAVKARAELASGEPEAAIETIKTGLAFARHVGDGPFYINALVGMSIANVMLERVEELVGRSEAPNLYWALTTLPRPMIGIIKATENERLSIDRVLGKVGQPRSEGEWTIRLASLQTQIVRLEELSHPDGARPYGGSTNLEAFKEKMLPKARDYLKERQIATTSDDQALVLAITGQGRELLDDNFKLAYLPYPEAGALEGEVGERTHAAKSGAAFIYADFLPAIQAVHLSEARLDRKIAGLRIVEAIRAHASGHQGQLPESLDQIKATPVPIDPFAGKPFEYRRDGDSAVLTGVSSSSAFGLAYRITVRK